MKLLLDACIGKTALGMLRKAGHDVVRIQEPGVSDAEVLARALEENRILITADKGFGELIFHRRTPHPGVMRLVGLRPAEQGHQAMRVLERHGQDLLSGTFIVVQKSGVRVRRSPWAEEGV